MCPTSAEPTGTSPAAPEPPLAVELVGISKRFGQVVANHDARLTVPSRSVHALVGENGAGKSTLMKVLAGVEAPDAGTVRILGKPLRRADPREAIARGIGMVYQHFMLVEPLTVAENLVLGHEPSRGGLLNLGSAERAVDKLGAEYGLAVDPRARIADLSVGEQQRVEILKVLYRGARVLVLDEPTAVLTPSEVDGLFVMLRRFVDQGRTIIIITHKLDEVMAISDRVTVMRRGQTVDELRTADTSARELAHLMVGREVELGRPDKAASPARQRPRTPALEVEDLVVERRALKALDRVSLRVWPGEILGVAGVQGNGQSELMQAIAGLCPAASGAVRLGGVDVTHRSPRQRLAAGLAHIPEDRHQRGLVLELDVAENLMLGRQREFRGRLGLDLGRLARHGRGLVERFDIRPPRLDVAAGALSGGNQQKVVVGREMSRKPRALLAGQPTRGVDIGAVEAIHQHLRKARDDGLGVLLVSADLAELLALSDRIAVLYGGQVAAVMDAREAQPAELGELMLGARPPPGSAP